MTALPRHHLPSSTVLPHLSSSTASPSFARRFVRIAHDVKQLLYDSLKDHDAPVPNALPPRFLPSLQFRPPATTPPLSTMAPRAKSDEDALMMMRKLLDEPQDVDRGAIFKRMKASIENYTKFDKAKHPKWTPDYKPNFPDGFEDGDPALAEWVDESWPIYDLEFKDGTWPLIPRYVILSTAARYVIMKFETADSCGAFWPANFDKHGRMRPDLPPFGLAPAIRSNNLNFAPIYKDIIALLPEHIARAIGYQLRSKDNSMLSRRFDCSYGAICLASRDGLAFVRQATDYNGGMEWPMGHEKSPIEKDLAFDEMPPNHADITLFSSADKKFFLVPLAAIHGYARKIQPNSSIEKRYEELNYRGVPLVDSFGVGVTFPRLPMLEETKPLVQPWPHSARMPDPISTCVARDLQNPLTTPTKPPKKRKMTNTTKPTKSRAPRAKAQPDLTESSPPSSPIVKPGGEPAEPVEQRVRDYIDDSAHIELAVGTLLDQSVSIIPGLKDFLATARKGQDDANRRSYTQSRATSKWAEDIRRAAADLDAAENDAPDLDMRICDIAAEVDSYLDSVKDNEGLYNLCIEWLGPMKTILDDARARVDKNAG